MVRGFGKVFKFYRKEPSFFQRQDFKGGVERNSADADISFECDILLSWITRTNLQWHKTKNICSEKVMGLISLYILLEQFLAILNILHLFSIQLIFLNTFLTHSIFRKMRKKQLWFNRFNHTKNIFSTMWAILSSTRIN